MSNPFNILKEAVLTQPQCHGSKAITMNTFAKHSILSKHSDPTTLSTRPSLPAVEPFSSIQNQHRNPIHNRIPAPAACANQPRLGKTRRLKAQIRQASRAGQLAQDTRVKKQIPA